ncbi:unnamed protein product [Urochloa decumbens]|uniref:EF-hand domain-containing protein n=1 Tax=Urochloa decumbens TaxID=240449 RepID=A0ABC9DYI9_9POAL
MAGRGQWPAVSIMNVLLTWIVCCNCVHGYMHFGRKLNAAALAKYHAGDNMTDLQHHVQFFDKNKDGIITLTESIQSFIAIGIEPVFATTAATATHAAFGPLTTPPGKLPSTNIHVSHIHGAIHASDTGSYNKKGMFVPENFDKIFKRHSHIKPNALAWWEIEAMLIANRNILQPWTWPAAELEWQLIYMLGKDSRGYLHKDTVRGIYDGSVFPKLAERTVTLHSEA